METSITYTDKQAYFSSDEKKWINKIRKLKEQHPEDINIIKEPADNDGCLYCTIPSAWLKLRPKTERNMTEEEKQAARDRLLTARKK